MSESDGIAEELKTEAKEQLAIAGRRFFRVATQEQYEQIAEAYVIEIIKDLKRRFETEGDVLRQDFVSVELAFCTVIDTYVEIATSFDKLCPLEKQIQSMLRKVKAPSGMIEVNTRVIGKPRPAKQE